MAGSYSNDIDVGSFVPTTIIYDTSLIQSLDLNSDSFRDFLVTLTQSINQIALVLNTKDSGYYALQEFVNGQIYFPDPTLSSSTANLPVLRQVFRLVVNFGILPNTGMKSVPHTIPNISADFSFTRIYATASDPLTFVYIPIPFIAVAGNIIQLTVDAVNVNITTNFDATNFTICYVVLEYLKQ